MKLRPLVLATLGAMALVSSSLLTGLGHSREQVSLSVEVGGGRPMQAYTSFLYSYTEGVIEPNSGYIVFSVLDERGLASGWSVVFDSRRTVDLPETLTLDSAIPIAQGIQVRQGNSVLDGHSIEMIGSTMRTDTLRWTTEQSFGDGEYDLVLLSTMLVPNDEVHTLFVTMCGSAP